jgi:hypothetical protein
MAWTTNSIMSWRTPGTGTIVRVSDHGRSTLSEDWERIETKTRMADGTLRRYSVSKKRTWSCSWTGLPSTNNIVGGLHTVDGGMAGEDIELWVNTINVPFRMILRRGSAEPIVTPPNPADGLLPYQDANFYIANVMITEYNKEVVKRGKLADLWDVSITLEEV